MVITEDGEAFQCLEQVAQLWVIPGCIMLVQDMARWL